jgi:hypothetical protein
MNADIQNIEQKAEIAGTAFANYVIFRKEESGFLPEEEIVEDLMDEWLDDFQAMDEEEQAMYLNP